MNIFLTGDINIGKSTIIDEVIKKTNIKYDDILGFKTKALLKKDKVIGFYIEAINYRNIDIDKRIIGKEVNGKWVGITRNFESFGLELVKHIINSKAKLVILDELGFFEREVLSFKRAYINYYPVKH